MPDFKHVNIPDGDLVTIADGKPVVGDRPIIGSLRGDGIGLDITPAMKNVVESAVKRAYGGKKEIVWCPVYVGLEGLHKYGEVLPRESIEAIQYLKIAIKGPFTTPIGEETHVCLNCAHQQYHDGKCDKCGKDDGVAPRFRSINVGLRQAMDLYACVRPIMYFEGVPAPNKYADQVNMVIFRENTEDVYAGHDFERGSETAKAIIELVKQQTGREIREDSGIGIKPISVTGTKRLVRKACHWAIANALPSVTLVHKGNIMKFTEGSFAKWGYEVATEEFGDTFVSEKVLWDELNGKMPQGKKLVKDRIADSIFQQIQTRPGEYAVLALPNLNARPRRQHRRGGGAVRSHARYGAQVHGDGQGEPRLAHPLGGDDAAAHGMDGGGGPGAQGYAAGHQGRARDLRPGPPHDGGGSQGRERSVVLRLRRGDRRADVGRSGSRK
jgi:isocitrate dehydrogenase